MNPFLLILLTLVVLAAVLFCAGVLLRRWRLKDLPWALRHPLYALCWLIFRKPWSSVFGLVVVALLITFSPGNCVAATMDGLATHEQASVTPPVQFVPFTPVEHPIISYSHESLWDVSISQTAAGYSVSNPPTLQGGVQQVWDAIKAGTTNLYGAVDGMYANKLKSHWGGGVGVFYPVSTYVVTGIRIDYLDGGFWMPEGNATLQVPITVFSWLIVKPFFYMGIGVPVSGTQVEGFKVPGKIIDNNGQPTAITGPGVAVRVWTSKTKESFIDIGYDQEKWSGFPGTQTRFGAVFQAPLEPLIQKIVSIVP